MTLRPRSDISATAVADETSPPPFKRQRTNEYAVDVDHDCCQAMKLIPPELVNIILSYLHPADLLSLSRVDKAFRGFLHFPGNKTVWRVARDNVSGLPPCPEWFSEPRYASLHFDHHCDVCGANVGHEATLWAVGARYCDICRVQALSAVDPLEGSRRKYRCLRTSFLTLCVIRCIALETQAAHVPWKVYFSLADADALIHELDAAKDETSRIMLLVSRVKKIGAQNENAFLCRTWQHERRRQMQRERMAVQRQRRKTIMRRMEELGYRAEVASLGLLSAGLRGTARDLVLQPRPLTDAEWVHITPIIVKVLQDRTPVQQRIEERALYRRRLRLLVDAFKEFRSYGQHGGVLPHPADLSRTTEIRTIMKLARDSDAALSVSAFSHSLPRLIEDWILARYEELIAKSAFLPTGCAAAHSSSTPASIGRGPEVSSPLDLACAIYYCSSCNLPLFASGAIVHPCCYRVDTTWKDTVNDRQWLNGILPVIEGDVYENACLVHFAGRLPWTPDPLRALDVTTSKIIEACGEDPSKATIAHMDKLSARISCSKCAVEGRSTLVMGWRAAIYHSLQHDSGCLEWEAVPPATRIRVLQAERANQASSRLSEETTYWECSHCLLPSLLPPPTSMSCSRGSVARHILKWHKDETSEADFRVSGDTFEMCDPVRVISDVWRDRPDELGDPEKRDVERGRAIFTVLTA